MITRQKRAWTWVGEEGVPAAEGATNVMATMKANDSQMLMSASRGNPG